MANAVIEAHLTLMQDIRQVLTADQQKQFHAMLAHHHGREEGEHHDHGEGEHR